ncbi:hypothetical protein [Polaribacter sp. R77954]|uniref:hypothetical protein n=1 Tax=Polaribacter sp. R77954 TaxID=3093870 RepID=UPI0037C6ABEF
MRNLKSIIAIIAISLATTFSTHATEKNYSKVTQQLRTELVSMLGDKVQVELKESTSGEISFMVNNKNEIVIISVDSNVTEFNSLVKRKLNYKKINVKGVKKQEIYIIPVKINAA